MATGALIAGPQTHGVIIYKRWGERTESPFVMLLPSGAEERKGSVLGSEHKRGQAAHASALSFSGEFRRSFWGMNRDRPEQFTDRQGSLRGKQRRVTT